MQRQLLNLALLRGETSANEGLPTAATAAVSDAGRDVSLSRRRLIGASGIVAIGFAPVLRAIGATIRSEFDVVATRDRVAFLVDGDERWTIDAARFGGTPRVSYDRQGDRIEVALSGARYPGTDVTADFSCTVQRGVSGWRMTLDHAFGHFRAEAPFAAFLAGTHALESTVELDASLCSMADGTTLVGRGVASGRLQPDWSMHLEGDAIAAYAGLGDALASDSLKLSLLATESASILESASSKRSLLEIERGAREWMPTLPERATAGWSFSTTASPFDQLTIEAGETRGGSIAHAVVAESVSDAPALMIHPCAGIVGSDGLAGGLPLRNARYASAMSDGAIECAIVARFSDESVWLHAPVASIQLADREGVRPLEIVTLDGVLQSYRIEPALIATYISVPGALSEAAPMPETARASFVIDGAAGKRRDVDDAAVTGGRGERRDVTDIRVNHLRPDDPPLTMMLATVMVPIIRPQDLVHIVFEFPGMKVEAQGSGRVAVASGGAGYLVAHFPPQNIAEQAFLETESPATSENPLGPPPVLPVKTRLSGPSRLAFKVPGGTSKIDINAKTLLKAMTDWEPSVAPTALPPQFNAELNKIIEIDSLKYVAAWGTYGKRLGIESYNKEAMSPLAKTAGSEAFAGLPKGMKRSATETKEYVSYRSTRKASSGAIARGGSAVTDVALSSRSLAAARLTSSKLVNSRDTFEAKYQIDISDIEMSTPSTIEKLKAAYAAIRPELVKPAKHQTAIESPYRLIISPNRYGRWAHATEPVVHTQPVSSQDFTELWHTRLGVEPAEADKAVMAVDEESTAYRTIRAIWMESPVGFNPDWKFIPPNYEASGPSVANPFRMSIDEKQRHNIVHLSANFKITMAAQGGSAIGKTYEPLPVKVDRLMLTSLGSWMNFRGAWPVTLGMSPLSVEEWRHRATMGRDHYVRIVEKGYLFPFGHRASFITITERKFHKAPWGGNVAYLRQKMYILVREPEKNFRSSGLVRSGATVIKGSNGESIDLKMPFHKVRITTTLTPKLDAPGDTDINGQGTSAFWPYVAAKPFNFQFIGTDLDNQTVEFSMPLVFIMNTIANTAATLKTVRTAYDGADTPANGLLPTTSMSGQKIAFAESEKPGDTSYETESISFSGEVPEQSVTLPPDQPRFYPVMKRSKLSIPSIKYMAGNDKGSEFKYNIDFLKVGFGSANAGKLLLDLYDFSKPIGMDFANKGEKSGGMVQPSMNIIGLSRAMGPISGAIDSAVNFEKSLKNITENKFEPEDFFKGLNAKLFGVIDLWTILEALGLDKAPQFITEALTPLVAIQNDLNALKAFAENPAVGGAGNAVKNAITDVLAALPNIISDPSQFTSALESFRDDVNALKNALPTLNIDDAGVKRSLERMLIDFSRELDKITEFVSRLAAALEIPKELKITLEWAPELKSWPASTPLFVASSEGKKASLRLGAEMIAQTSMKSVPKFEIYCRLENFSVDLIAPVASFIVLHFRKLEFFANSSMKSDITCDFGGIEFVGILSFIETLKSLIPLDGFSDPPAIDVSPSGISASFSIALPNLAVGVFSLSNMALFAGFKVPFIGEPLSFTFAFCSRENPFLLTVSMIGGGGFFGITINPAGVHILEASFEAGAQLALDFGVASGSIYAFVGFYFKMEDDDASLTGYFRCGGEVDVLGIISVSIELYLSLTYEFATGKCIGRATLTICIEILFFDITVEISCEKKFAGANGDPTFAQTMAPYSAPSLTAPDEMMIVEPWKQYAAAFAW